MNIGDLVRYSGTPGSSDHWGELGLVLRTIPGTAARTIVLWNSGSKCSYPAYQLEVINESR